MNRRNWYPADRSSYWLILPHPMKNALLFLLLLAGVAAPAWSQPIAAAGPAPALSALPTATPVYMGVLLLCVLGGYFVLNSYASPRRFRR